MEPARLDSQYAQEYYAQEREHWWYVVREKILVQALRSKIGPGAGLRVLNVGAATGRSSQALAAFGEVTSVEYDPVLCEFLRTRLRIEVIQASVTELPFADDSFDLVCAFDVIEHVQDDGLAAAELARVCRPGGTVAITVPAFQSLWSQHDEINHHFRRYLSPDVGLLFAGKLRLEYATYFNSLLFVPIWVYRMLSRWLPKPPGSGSDFQAINPKSLVNRFFYAVFSLELLCLRFLRFPLGVSLLHLYSK